LSSDPRAAQLRHFDLFGMEVAVTVRKEGIGDAGALTWPQSQIARLEATIESLKAALQNLKAKKQSTSEEQFWQDYNISFEDWAADTGKINGVPARAASLSTSWGLDTKYGAHVLKAMNEAEIDFSRDLLRRIKDDEIPGAICEFGVFEGDWLRCLSDHCQSISLDRPIFGFDSFEGLPAPTEGLDIVGFSEGDYSAKFEAVQESLECDRRRITLVKGWFSDTLKEKVASEIKQISYARIDCDLYEPAMECLEYLESRLSDGAILVFDDWSWWFGHGESRAFFEWARRTSLTFEFVGYTSWIHLYLRVKRDVAGSSAGS